VIEYAYSIEWVCILISEKVETLTLTSVKNSTACLMNCSRIDMLSVVARKPSSVKRGSALGKRLGDFAAMHPTLHVLMSLHEDGEFGFPSCSPEKRAIELHVHVGVPLEPFAVGGILTALATRKEEPGDSADQRPSHAVQPQSLTRSAFCRIQKVPIDLDGVSDGVGWPDDQSPPHYGPERGDESLERARSEAAVIC